jgi:hypothetical protein
MSRAPAGAQDQGGYVNQRASCVPAGTRKIYYACPGGYASLHRRLHSTAPTGACNNFTEFASKIFQRAGEDCSLLENMWRSSVPSTSRGATSDRCGFCQSLRAGSARTQALFAIYLGDDY